MRQYRVYMLIAGAKTPLGQAWLQAADALERASQAEQRGQQVFVQDDQGRFFTSADELRQAIGAQGT